MNNRGQIFSIYLVVFTLFLCGVVVALYVVQQGNAEASLVSPVSVLEMRDELNIFEMREVELIKSSLDGASGEFKSDEFRESFRDGFISGFMADENMAKFLFSDLFIGGVEVREQDKNRNLLEEGVYPEVLTSPNGGKISFGRARVKKFVLLTAVYSDSKIDIPVDFSFEFEREYLISNVSGEFEVTKI